MNSASIIPLQAFSGSQVLSNKFGYVASHDIGHTSTELNFAQDQAVTDAIEANSLVSDLKSNIAQGNMGGVESLLPRFDSLVNNLKQQASLLTQAYFYLRSFSYPLVNFFGSLISGSKKSECISVKDYSTDDLTKQFTESLKASLGIEAVNKVDSKIQLFRTDLDFVTKNINGLGEFLKSIDPNLQVIIQAGKWTAGSHLPIQIIFRGTFPWSSLTGSWSSDQQRVGFDIDKCRHGLMNIASRIVEIPKEPTSRDLKAVTIELTNLYNEQESLDDLRKLHADLNPSP